MPPSPDPAAPPPARPALGRALEGYRVVDFSSMMAGPYCTRWLADLGAEVVKVEPPEGDTMRGGPPLRNGHSSYFGQLNAGKRSVVLNLKQPDALAAARALAAKADVLVENYRPGVMQRLGLGWPALQALNPRLVYCSISGYGQSGPKAARPAYAPVVQAASGYEMAHFAFQDGLDRPANSGLFVADVLAATYAVMAIQAALLQRARTQHGQHLDVTLMESMLNVMVFEVQDAQFPSGRRRHLYLPHKASDGFVIVAPVSQRNFENLAQAIGRPEMVHDPRFADAAARRTHWAELMAAVGDWCAARSGADCEATLMAAGVPCARYAGIGELLADPHFVQRGSLAAVRDGGGLFQVPQLPFRMSGADTTVRSPVPGLGEHTTEVLAELGLPAPR